MDTPVRSLVKTLSWRALATLITATLTICITGSWELGVALGAVDTVVKLFISSARYVLVPGCVFLCWRTASCIDSPLRAMPAGLECNVSV